MRALLLTTVLTALPPPAGAAQQAGFMPLVAVASKPLAKPEAAKPAPKPEPEAATRPAAPPAAAARDDNGPAPELPVEVDFATSPDSYLIKPKKKSAEGSDSEDPTADEKTAAARKARLEQSQKDAVEAEANKLVAGVRTLVFRARPHSGPSNPVQMLGEAKPANGLPLAAVSAPDQPARGIFTAIADARAGFGPIVSDRRPIAALPSASLAELPAAVAAATPDPAQAMALPPPAARPVETGDAFKATAAANAAPVEIVAISQARPFPAIVRSAGTELPRLATPAVGTLTPVESPAFAAAPPAADLLATP